MKYYKQNNEVFAYELDGSQDHLIGDKVLMTAEEVEAHINPPKTPEQLEAERKALIAQQLEVLTVTTAAGNVFDANVQARLDISNAIMISDAAGITETVWRLADDSEVLVTVAELKEALMLALTEYVRIKGIGA